MARPRKHDGVVYRRKGTQFWWMRYRDRAGTRREEPTGTADWKEAQKKLRERLQARDDNVLEIVRKGEQLTLREWADLFLENYSKPPLRTPKTHEANERAVMHLNEAFGDRKLADLSSGRDRRVSATSAASSACGGRRKAGIVEKGRAQAVDGSSGIAGASTDAERRGSEEAAAVESVLGRRVSGGGEGVVPTALRVVVGAAADRGGGAELLAQRRSGSSRRPDFGSTRN